MTPRDAAARELVSSSALDRSLLVEAAAGSGKTTSLVARVVSLLAAGVPPDGMAVITFTRKAAAELRGRVQLRLERAVREEPDAARRERLRRSIREYDLLYTGTVHSFCGRLLRERPVEAGVPPDFVELDELADEALRQEAWQDLVARMTLQGDPDWQVLRDAGVNADALGEALRVMCTHEEVEFPAVPVELPPPGLLWERFQAAFAPLDEAVPAVLAPEVTCKLMGTVAAIRRAVHLDRGRRLLSTLALAAGRAAQAWGSGDLPEVSYKDWTSARTRREWLAAVERPRALASKLGHQCQELVGRWRAHLYYHALAVLRPAVAAVRQRRRANRGLNFADLLVCTARLLRERADVRADLQARFHHLLVDEFQDTDPLQAEVMLLLTADDQAVSDWRQVRPRPGALFVVGDPQQSIYRFTRADIQSYAEVRARFDPADIISLTSNFRSAPALTQHVNRACADSFTAHAGSGRGPQYVPLDAERAPFPGRLAGVRLLRDEGSGRKGEVTDRDAERVARFIRGAVESGLPVEDSETGQARPCRPDDFLVLTQVKRPLALYARALEEQGVPVEVSGGGALAGSEAVFALVQVLRAVADPHDQPAVVGALRGPLCGLSDRALYLHRRAGGSFDLFAEQPEGEVGEAVATLGRWSEAGREVSPPALVHRVLEESGFLALLAASPSASSEGGLLAWTIDRARFVAEQGGGLGAVVSQLLADLADPQIEGLPLEPGRPGSVQVMNLHKAKGLEAPVVVLAGPRHALPEWVTWRVVRGATGAPQGFLAVTQPSRFGGSGPVLAAPLDWPEHERAELAFRAAERTRLMYVAATRARDLLVVSAATSPQAEVETSWAEVLGGEPWPDALPEPAPAPRLPAPPADLSAEVVTAAREVRRARLERASVPSFRAQRVTALGPPFEYADRERADGAPGGRAWGRLVHALLERVIAAGPAADPLAVERIAGFLLELEEGDDPDLAGRAAGLVLALRDSAVWVELASAEELHLEVPVAGPLPPEQGPGRVHGVIDCLYLRGGQWTLLDWKTGSTLTPEGELQPAYVDQVRRYGEMWRAATGLAPDRLGLVALDQGTVHWL